MPQPAWDPSLEAAWRAHLAPRERRTALWLGTAAAFITGLTTLVGLLVMPADVEQHVAVRLGFTGLMLLSLPLTWWVRTLGQVRALQAGVHVCVATTLALTAGTVEPPLVGITAATMVIWGPIVVFRLPPAMVLAFCAVVPISQVIGLAEAGLLGDRTLGVGLLLLLSSAGVATVVGVLRWRSARETFRANHALTVAKHEVEATLRRLVDAQMQLVQSEKLASLGQLVAGVAHELNTPLGAIEASVGNLEDALDHTLQDLIPALGALGPDARALLGRLLAPLSEGREQPADTRAARTARRALTQELQDAGVPDARPRSTQLLALGFTSPVGALARDLAAPRAAEVLARAARLATLRRSTDTLRVAGQRASHVVRTLRAYAYPGGEGRLAEPTDGRIAEALDTVLALMRNRAADVEILREDTDPGEVWAHHEQLNQVWTHLIGNALQAMDGAGTLTLGVHADRDGVRVDVGDTGPGVPEDLRRRIFDPFFTTKPPGEGSGLGLSICQEIVTRHGGSLTLSTAPGETVFSVWLPRGFSSPQEDGAPTPGTSAGAR